MSKGRLPLCEGILICDFCSERFADALKKAGARAELILCEGKSHTDLFLQVS